jgi:hypothetical protein
MVAPESSSETSAVAQVAVSTEPLRVRRSAPSSLARCRVRASMDFPSCRWPVTRYCSYHSSSMFHSAATDWPMDLQTDSDSKPMESAPPRPTLHLDCLTLPRSPLRRREQRLRRLPQTQLRRGDQRRLNLRQERS